MHQRTLVFVFSLVATFTSTCVVAAQGGSAADASVVDEGDVVAATQGLQGSTNAGTSTSCASCSTVGASGDTPPLAVVGSVLALGAAVYRRRRH